MAFEPELLLLGKVGAAMVLGGLIGIEREILHKPAGFRTHMLVAGAAALLVGMGDAMLRLYATEPTFDAIRADPMRILEAIITGISFLGAGTIFRGGQRAEVGGLTTAASILMAAAIGVAAALEQWITALAITLLVLLVLRGLRAVERWLERKRP